MTLSLFETIRSAILSPFFIGAIIGPLYCTDTLRFLTSFLLIVI